MTERAQSVSNPLPFCDEKRHIAHCFNWTSGWQPESKLAKPNKEPRGLYKEHLLQRMGRGDFFSAKLRDLVRDCESEVKSENKASQDKEARRRRRTRLNTYLSALFIIVFIFPFTVDHLLRAIMHSSLFLIRVLCFLHHFLPLEFFRNIQNL